MVYDRFSKFASEHKDLTWLIDILASVLNVAFNRSTKIVNISIQFQAKIEFIAAESNNWYGCNENSVKISLLVSGRHDELGISVVQYCGHYSNRASPTSQQPLLIIFDVLIFIIINRENADTDSPGNPRTCSRT